MPHLSVASIVAEVSDEPLVVELVPGMRVTFPALAELPAEDVDAIMSAIESVSVLDIGDAPSTDQLPTIMRAMNTITKHAMSPEDYRRYLSVRVPLRVLPVLCDAVMTHYMAAGTPGEGDASAR